MAQKVNIVLTDDIDGNDADETVWFGLDGKSYVIDLSEKNATKLRKALQPFVVAARKAGGKSKRSAKSSSDGTKPAEVREWARQNGWPDVPARGRIPADVKKAYESA